MNGNVERAAPAKGQQLGILSRSLTAPCWTDPRAAPRQPQRLLLNTLSPKNQGGLKMRKTYLGLVSKEGQREREAGEEVKSSPTTEI